MSDRTAKFSEIFDTFWRLGLNVVPAHPLKKHPAGAWKGLAEPGCRRVTQDDLAAGAWILDAFPEHEMPAFAFGCSAAPGFVNLVIVDVDDMRKYLHRALDDFGDTPLYVETKRGVHMYFRTDGERKVTSRSWVYGERSVDVKGWSAGVMAPGSPRTDGGLYAPSVPLSDWTLELLGSLPIFDIDRYEALWSSHRPMARRTARENAARNPRAYVHVVRGEPVEGEAGLEILGDIAGDTMVDPDGGGPSVRMDSILPGTKVFAFDREDAHASGQIWRAASGQRFYTDWTLGVMWRIASQEEIEWQRSFSREPDPQQGDALLAKAIRDHYPFVEVFTLPSEGFLDLEFIDGLTLVRAPHGTGKTWLARECISKFPTAISVCNTSALAEHNAARFGISCYQETDSSEHSKVSTTINSLPKIKKKEVDVFHIDEADQVHGYLHSKKVPLACATMHVLLDRLAQAKKGIVTSADLSFEDMCWYIEAVQKRSPGRPVRVYVRPPKPGALTVRLVPLTRAKQEYDEIFERREPGEPPLVLGITARNSVAQLSYGYKNRKPDQRAFWVSGENSRFYETNQRFRGQWVDHITGTSDFLEAADVFFFSPALQNGVSLEHEVGGVFLLHNKADLESETIAQMITRFRRATVVTWGVSSFNRRYIRVDDAYLEAVCIGLQQESDRQLAQSLPDYRGHFPNKTPVDPEFAWSWRITQRRIRRAYADPIGRAKEVIAEHGWILEDHTDGDSDFEAEAFNTTYRIGQEYRDAELADAIAHAAPLNDEDARKIERAHVHHGNDSQRLERRRLTKFYGTEEITSEFVQHVDKKGSFRKQCKQFVHLSMRVKDGKLPPDQTFVNSALGFHDWRFSRGKQPSEYRHIYQRASMLWELYEHVLGPFEIVREEVEAQEIQDKVLEFLTERGTRWRELFGGARLRDGTQAVRWFGVQLKRAGVVVGMKGRRESKRYSYSFEVVRKWSRHYEQRLIDEFDKEKEREEWQTIIENLRTK